MPKKKHSVSDNKLSTLWAKAVKAKYKRCPVSRRCFDLQAHHIIAKGRQRRFALRWDIRNGVPLSPDIHRGLHDGDLYINKAVLEYVERRGDLEHLQLAKNLLKQDFLKELGLTEDEYRLKLKAELIEIICEGCDELH
jgi:hypothetical protein